MTDTKTPTKRASSAGSGQIWTDEERAAMQSSARERKASSRRGSVEERAEGERDLRASIAKMPESDRSMAERLNGIVMAAVPDLAPKTYYGMPAYAKDGNVICWFKNASKFKTRYAMFEFSDKAHLDEGAMWPTSFALTELTAADEVRIVALVKKAAN
jgi:uncharacterized protein YdhG (YjbR/CyaY superfamily)